MRALSPTMTIIITLYTLYTTTAAAASAASIRDTLHNIKHGVRLVNQLHDLNEKDNIIIINYGNWT